MAISTNIRSVRMIQSVTGVSFSVEQNRDPALELCSMCGRREACEVLGRMTGYEHKNPVLRLCSVIGVGPTLPRETIAWLSLRDVSAVPKISVSAEL